MAETNCNPGLFLAAMGLRLSFTLSGTAFGGR
jgi:hypothetical protein